MRRKPLNRAIIGAFTLKLEIASRKKPSKRPNHEFFVNFFPASPSSPVISSCMPENAHEQITADPVRFVPPGIIKDRSGSRIAAIHRSVICIQPLYVRSFTVSPSSSSTGKIAGSSFAVFGCSIRSISLAAAVCPSSSAL